MYTSAIRKQYYMLHKTATECSKYKSPITTHLRYNGLFGKTLEIVCLQYKNILGTGIYDNNFPVYNQV